VKGQSTVELALLLPVLTGLIALTLQGGVVLSDQISLQHYANEAGLWAEHNDASATTTAIQTHVYQQMCGGASGPPSSSGSKYCAAGLSVAVTLIPTPTSQAAPSPTSDVLAAATCKTWDLSVSPASTTSAQGQSLSYTVTLINIAGHGNWQLPTVSLSISGYPNATSPGFPTFNPPTVDGSSTTSTVTFSTTSTSTPQRWTMQFGGRDQCGAGPATGLVNSALTLTGPPAPSPCPGGITVLQPSPATVPAGSATTITIPGTGFPSSASVKFGAAAASSVTYVSSTQLTASVPGTVPVGVYNVTVTDSAGCSGTALNGLTVQASAGPSPSPSASPSPTFAAAGFNACAGGSGSYETRVVISWRESLLIPWLTQSMQLTATQFTFCQ